MSAVGGTEQVGAIDCGTNSIRLLIADRDRSPGAVPLRDLHREMRIVRLGEGVDATGRFTLEALARTRAALEDYATLLAGYQVGKVRMVATSATRDAANREEFFAMTATVLGSVVPGAIAEVISGTEEAELSFIGAVGELDSAAAPFVVVDLGGGSTEVVLGQPHGGARACRPATPPTSVCVRMTERCLHSDPPTTDEVAAAREVVRQRLAEALEVVPVEQARTWVGVAGDVHHPGRIGAGDDDVRLRAIHLSGSVSRAVGGLRTTDRDDARPARRPRTDARGPGRRDRWWRHRRRGTGRRTGERAGIGELIVSEHDILDGIALSIP